MSERPKPYVGVSGVVTPEQQDVLNMFATPLREEGRRLALGVKATRKTQWDDMENKYTGDWYPVGHDIATSLEGGSDPFELRVAQVFMDANEAERDDDYEGRFMRRLLGRTARWLGGVQFDMLPWHLHDYRPLFDELKTKRPDVEILLQAYGPIMEQLGPSETLEALDDYGGYVDHVLFDASHGTGRELDARSLAPFVEEAASRDWLGVGVAGGLDADRVERLLPPLLSQFPALSFDAEGRLHVSNEHEGRGINIDAAKEYLDSAYDVIVSAEPSATSNLFTQQNHHPSDNCV